jgi:hypothetical protein
VITKIPKQQKRNKSPTTRKKKIQSTTLKKINTTQNLTETKKNKELNP